MTLDEMVDLIFPRDLEPLTDALIAELVGRGWPESDLRKMAGDGARYCRSRNSLFFPPEFEAAA